MAGNHINYQERLDFIEDLLHKRHNRAILDITTVEYDPNCPFQYNNFVYRVTLSSPVRSETAPTNKPTQPGCVPIPDGTTSLIMRLANPKADGMNSKNRVENEVAMIDLVSAALNQVDMKVVPSVYDWGSAAVQSSQGWILQQLMPGVPLHGVVRDMDPEGKSIIFAQMAKMLGAIQRYQLPGSITGFGGLTFDAAGRTVSAAMTSVDAGPWSSYEQSYRGRLRVALEKADANPFIKGWHASGLRKRLEAFVEKDWLFNFTTNNILYDPASKRITALLDYDFACISHASYEFLRSFDGYVGQFRGWSGDEDSEQMAIRSAKLHGFPSPLPNSSKEGLDWVSAKAWEDELEEAQVQRPRTTEGIEKVADVDAILRGIMPWRVTNSDMMRMQSEEVIMKCKEESEQQLVKMLGRLGF